MIDAFAAEAACFHDIRFSTYSITQNGVNLTRKFETPNHNIVLWQYYGSVRGEDELQQLDTNIMTSDIGLAGLRGAQLSHYGLLEGVPLPLFLRMAKRAGALFDAKTAQSIQSKVTEEIMSAVTRSDPSVLPMSTVNSNPLAIWLNYLLYHLSLTNHEDSGDRCVEPDPFALSLLALERLEEERELGKIDRSTSAIDKIQFKVALSFPGEHRPYVAEVAEKLRNSLGLDAVFYDHDYQSQLARPNLDLLLADIYAKRAQLLVVFLSAEYPDKRWCGLEWRSIRSLISERADSAIMYIRFDDNEVGGVLPIDGYLDARRNKPVEIAKCILQRLSAMSSRPA